MIVVDASLATKWVLWEQGSLQAIAFYQANDEAIAAPDLILTEVTSAIVRHVNMGQSSLSDAEEALMKWAQGYADAITLHRLTPDMLLDAARLAIELGHPLADTVYLALAIALDCPLATCDAKFYAKAAQDHSRIQLLRYH